MSYFTEMPGSPSWSINKQGFVGRRTFMVAWENQLIFLKSLWGGYTVVNGSLIDNTPPAKFPFFPSAVVSNAECRPFDGDPPGPGDISSISTGAASYRKAIISATYSTAELATTDKVGLPNVAVGFLTFSTSGGAEYMTIPGRTWHWSGGSDKVSEDVSPGILIPTREMTVTWNRCPSPPFTTIEACQGKVNSSTFLGYPAETVLFRSDSSNITFKEDDNELWTVEFGFSVRCIDGTYGWNHFYKPGGSWTKIQDDSSHYPYKTYNLESLFYIS